MKILLTISLITFSTISLSVAQEADTAIIRVFYALNHQQDTANKADIYKENMVLSVGRNASHFSSYDKLAQFRAIEKDQQDQTKSWNGPGLPVIKRFTGARKLSTIEIFRFPSQKKAFTKEFLIIDYLYEEPFEDIKWTLGAEQKIIEKISCQKATTTFKGRQWTVWFASEIPFETGPWKLHGLPGLILEAYDLNREVEFLFTGLESVGPASLSTTVELSDYSPIITLPKKAVKITLAESNKIKESMYKNPKGFFTAQIDANGGLLDTKQYAGLSLKKTNNPIELTTGK